ncbi:hypothetical protein QYE76_048843 [Lolium multiflorum]|uniref:Uncharacterized protein n=1 Tax=Lolium multiflorum TaxID=4521 RepID=A0AAD8WFS2_LOLMU|nr:hypothetical protein QYE76_048843 [Lolium multiflorum]
MRKSDTFVWTPQADAAFKELKQMLATAPVLASPLEREPMLLYIAATNRVVSVVVVVERDEEGKTVQRPVYYLSEVLSLSKQNYPHFQKVTYGVFMAATKLKHYFEEHPMKVVSEAPISEIMGNKDASGRIAKWAIQLSPYVPVYERRDAIKSQALADFLVDWAEMQYKPPKPEVDYWKMHFDGSKLKEGLGAGVVLTSPNGNHLRYVLQIHFRASNNIAEYEALVHGLKVAKEIGAHRVICYGDSDLVVQQCSGDWDAKDANMATYRYHVQKIAGFFDGCEFHHVPRAENEATDTLSKLGSSRQEIPPGIALAHLRKPSITPSPESESIFVPESHIVPMDIDEGSPGTVPANPGTLGQKPEEAMMVDSMEIDVPVFVVREAPAWVEPIKEFLINGTLPVDKTESRRIQRRSKANTIINGEVYKKSVTGVLQRCVEPEEGKEMLVEIHQGGCGHHASSRALVAKVFRDGFYWPTALENAKDLVRRCNGCQSFRHNRRFRSLLLRGFAFFRRLLLVLAGIIFLLIFRYFIRDVSGRRDESAGTGKLSHPVRAVLALRSFGGVRVGTQGVEGIKVQLLILGAGNAKRCVSSGTGRRAFPLAEPFTGISEALGKKGQVLRYNLPGPQKLEDLHGYFRHVAKVPIDSLHVGDPGVQRNEVIVRVPRGIRITDNMFGPQLHHPLMRMRLGVREKL